MTAPQHHYETRDGSAAVCSGCGTRFSPEQWRGLPLVGYQDLDADGDQRLELRNCTCRADEAYTIGAPIERSDG